MGYGSHIRYRVSHLHKKIESLEPDLVKPLRLANTQSRFLLPQHLL